MNYQQLQDYALESALAHHLSNLDELMWEAEPQRTAEEVITMVDEGHPDVVAWEPFEFYEPQSLANLIGDSADSKFREYIHVLNEVVGVEWVADWKKGE